MDNSAFNSKKYANFLRKMFSATGLAYPFHSVIQNTKKMPP